MTYGRPLLGLMCGLGLMLVGCGDPPVDAPVEAETAAVGSAIPAATHVAEQAEIALLGLDRVTFESLAPEATSEEKRRASEGPAARPLAESPLQMDRSTPTTLLDGALVALASRDVSALARLSNARPQLTQDDADDAARRFLSPAGSRYWGRIGDAVREGRVRVEEDDAGAVITVDVGGAAGTYRVRMRREVDGWYLAS